MEIQTIQSAMAGVRRIDAFLAQPERAMENGETAACGDVVLSHVTFGYGEAPVLRGFFHDRQAGRANHARRQDRCGQKHGF